MSRKVRADIHLDAIVHNYLLACRQSERAHAVAIVKADAYGHGAVQVARALAPHAPAFGVACIEEALVLREAGISQPVVLLEGFFDADELEVIAQQGFWTALHSYHQLEALEQAELKTPIPVWIKVDTGMHRLGFYPDEVPSVVGRLKASGNASELLLMSHFARSDEPENGMTEQQLACFDQVAAGLGLGVSLANSAAVMAWPGAHHNWMRPGIMLYGATPFAAAQAVADQLRPGMTLSSEVIAVRELEAGATVGYGATFRCERPTRIGTVAMGYGDGYPRHARNGTPVLVDGQRAPLAGRVSMDMLTVDLTDIPTAGIGSRVEFWGNNGLSVAEVARWSDTIAYDLLTGITRRVPRRYV